MGPNIGWGRVSGNHQGGPNSVSEVDGASYLMEPSAGSLGIDLIKGTMAPASISLWEKAPSSSSPDAK